MAKTRQTAKKAPRLVQDVTGQLAALMAMTVVELREKYQEVFGQACPSRNKDYLRKKIAYRIQELAEGGLSEQAKAKIEELAAGAPLRQRHSRKGKGSAEATAVASHSGAPKAVAQPGAERDPRLPPVGTVLRKSFKGTEHEVKVLAGGFEYQGKPYPSLSKVACDIAGSHWNGFAFFGLKAPSAKNGAAA